jgi:hypothetical protein
MAPIPRGEEHAGTLDSRLESNKEEERRRRPAEGAIATEDTDLACQVT